MFQKDTFTQLLNWLLIKNIVSTILYLRYLFMCLFYNNQGYCYLGNLQIMIKGSFILELTYIVFYFKHLVIMH